MTPELAAWGEPLFIFTLCVPRILMVLLVLPFTSPAVLSPLTRAGIAVSLALVVFPLVAPEYPAGGLSAGYTFAIITKELFIGFVIGYLVSILFWAVEAIGFFIDTHRGATLAGALNLSFGDESSPTGALLAQTFTVLFFVGGGAFVFLDGLYQSYQAWPLFSYFPSLNLDAAQFFIDQLDLLMYLTVFLAGPAVIAMFLAEMGLALMNRFVPQLPVFFLALPIKSALALLILVFYVSTLVYFLGDKVDGMGLVFSDLIGLI